MYRVLPPILTRRSVSLGGLTSMGTMTGPEQEVETR